MTVNLGHVHTFENLSCRTPISNHRWWKLPNPRYVIKQSFFFGGGETQICDCLWSLITFFSPREPRSKLSGKFWYHFVFLWFILHLFVFFFFFSWLRWLILWRWSSNAWGEASEIRGNGGRGGGGKEGTVREKWYVGQWRIAPGYCLLSAQSGKLIWFPVNPSDLNYERLPSLKSPWWLAQKPSAFKGSYKRSIYYIS